MLAIVGTKRSFDKAIQAIVGGPGLSLYFDTTHGMVVQGHQVRFSLVAFRRDLSLGMCTKLQDRVGLFFSPGR